MIAQPLVDPQVTTACKRCWTCDEPTPYQVGLCPVCWAKLPEAVQSVFAQAIACGQPWQGMLHMAICETLRVQRFRANQPPPRLRKPPTPKLTIADLDLEL